MHQAQVDHWGETPKYVEVANRPPPGPDEFQIRVEAVGIHRVVRSRAAGRHYSSGKPPHIPGIDGVGTTTEGERVYFFTFGKGVLAEYINLPKSSTFPLPKSADPVQVAASINPAMSSWMSFKARTTNLPQDFTVLVLGATSASGRVAIAMARALGAKNVIGVARNKTSMDALNLDESIVMAEDPAQTDFSNLDDVDVVLDYVYGPLTLHLFRSLKTPKPVQYVHIGVLSGQPEVAIPGEILRSKDLTIKGSGPGAWTMKAFAASIPDLLKIVPSLPENPVKTAKFMDVEKEWSYDGPGRLVFVP